MIVVAMAGAAVATAVTLDHSGEDVYAIPDWGVVLTLVLAGLVLAGGALALWTRRFTFAAVVLGAALLAVFGVLALLSFGILALGLAVVLMLVAARVSGPRKVPAGVGGALAGAALPLLIIFALGDPVVDCGEESLSGSENLFMSVGGGSTAASASDSPDGNASGSARGSNYEYSYRCENGELAQFTFRWR